MLIVPVRGTVYCVPLYLSLYLSHSHLCMIYPAVFTVLPEVDGSNEPVILPLHHHLHAVFPVY